MLALAAGDRRLPGLPGLQPVEPARRRELPLRPARTRWSARSVSTTTVHPDFGSGRRPIGIPFQIVAAGTRRSARSRSTTPASPTRARIRSRPRPKIEGGGDRHLLLVQRGTCRLFELFAAQKRGTKWRAGQRRDLRPALQPAAPAGLDERRRGRPADPARPRPLRRGQGGRDQARAALHRRSAPATRSSSRPATRLADGPDPARDGPAVPAKPSVEDRRPSEAGADRRHAR